MAFADDYIDVPARIAEFRAKYPDGTLGEFRPWQIVTVEDKTFLAFTAAAWRHEGDTHPGIGSAWEPVPGLTNFTKNSELQNAETSAWGRAIIAVGAADAKKGVASAEDIRNRRAEQTNQPAVDAVRAELASLDPAVAKRLSEDVVARAGAADLNAALSDDGWRNWLSQAIEHHKKETA